MEGGSGERKVSRLTCKHHYAAPFIPLLCGTFIWKSSKTAVSLRSDRCSSAQQRYTRNCTSSVKTRLSGAHISQGRSGIRRGRAGRERKGGKERGQGPLKNFLCKQPNQWIIPRSRKSSFQGRFAAFLMFPNSTSVIFFLFIRHLHERQGDRVAAASYEDDSC